MLCALASADFKLDFFALLIGLKLHDLTCVLFGTFQVLMLTVDSRKRRVTDTHLRDGYCGLIVKEVELDRS